MALETGGLAPRPLGAVSAGHFGGSLLRHSEFLQLSIKVVPS
jgi:hypothetical protein